jgi:hypothetical protein
MIELRHNALEFSFPQVHDQARGTIAFQRTLRTPDDNQPYPLARRDGSLSPPSRR